MSQGYQILWRHDVFTGYHDAQYNYHNYTEHLKSARSRRFCGMCIVMSTSCSLSYRVYLYSCLLIEIGIIFNAAYAVISHASLNHRLDVHCLLECHKPIHGLEYNFNGWLWSYLLNIMVNVKVIQLISISFIKITCHHCRFPLHIALAGFLSPENRQFSFQHRQERISLKMFPLCSETRCELPQMTVFSVSSMCLSHKSHELTTIVPFSGLHVNIKMKYHDLHFGTTGVHPIAPKFLLDWVHALNIGVLEMNACFLVIT